MDTIDQIQKLADGLYPTSDPDELGRLDRAIRSLTEIKRTSLAELEAPVDGKEYKVTESRSAKRSYNSAAIIASLSRADIGVKDILNSDAARLSWRWTELKRLFNQANLPLTTIGHEVEDLGEIDEPHVGEVWESYYQIKGI